MTLTSKLQRSMDARYAANVARDDAFNAAFTAAKLDEANKDELYEAYKTACDDAFKAAVAAEKLYEAEYPR